MTEIVTPKPEFLSLSKEAVQAALDDPKPTNPIAATSTPPVFPAMRSGSASTTPRSRRWPIWAGAWPSRSIPSSMADPPSSRFTTPVLVRAMHALSATWHLERKFWISRLKPSEIKEILAREASIELDHILISDTPVDLLEGWPDKGLGAIGVGPGPPLKRGSAEERARDVKASKVTR